MVHVNQFTLCEASSCTSLIKITKEELAEAGSFCMDNCPALTDSKLSTQNLAGAKKPGGR